MARDNVTFRFNIDMTQMTVKGRQAIKILEDLELKAGKAGAGMTRMGASASKAGQQTAASAVNFQTATQGMLNLSTAAVQTFTSISNLDRANNRAKMSVIAVARAEDLLNNKRQRLNDMTEAGITSGGKYANMQREIATAEADLTVKIEKKGIEQAAVNDIYMLFATNIANVTISSLQTITILFGQEKMAKLGSAAATKLMTFATWDNVRANRAAAFSMTGLKVGLGGTKIGFSLSTVAVRLHTAALNGLKIALGPIGLIFIGISAAMVAYETNLGGVKDTINELLGVKDPFEESLKKERALTQGLTEDNNALAGSFKKLIPVHEQYIKMMRDAAVNRGDSRLAASYQAQLQQPARQGNFSSGVGSPSFSGSGGTSYGGVSSGAVSSGGIIPSAYGSTTNTNSQVNQNIPTSPTTVISNDLPDPMGSILQVEMFKLLTPPEQLDTLIQLSISAGLSGNKIKQDAYMSNAESMRYEAESWRPRGIETDPVKAFNEIVNKNTSMKAIERKSYFPTGMSSSLKLGGERGDGSGLAFYLQSGGNWIEGMNKFRADRFDPNTGREIFFAGTGGEDIAKHIRDGGNFGRNKYGGGNPFLDKLGRIQAEGLNFTQGPNNIDFKQFSQSALGSPMAQRAAGMAYLNMQRNVSSGAGFSQAAIEAGASVSNEQRSVATPKSIRNAIRNKDGFNNSLGGLIMNELNSLKGSGQMVYSSAHRSLYKSRNFRGVPGRDVIREAVRLGIKGNVEFMDMIKAIPDVDREADDNIRQAHAAIRQAETIANDYISMINSAKSSIGFSDVILRRATAEGHSGQSMYANIGLLSATKRTNFNNTEIIEESKSKLSLTNSQIFSIRFNSTRGDRELQDRLRYVDQLEAMASGTSPL